LGKLLAIVVKLDRMGGFFCVIIPQIAELRQKSEKTIHEIIFISREIGFISREMDFIVVR
jgi:hypothetical protein